MKRRAVFLDRDGTINVDVGYPSDIREITLYDVSFEAVRKINRAGLLAVVVTNQSGIGRGLLTEKNAQEIHRYIAECFAAHQARLDAIYYCPHYPHSPDPRYRIECSCRKPLPGMALQAAADLNIEPVGSYMIGDKVEDIQFGLAIRATSILVLTGFGEKSLPLLKQQGILPAFVAAHVGEAVDWILDKERRCPSTPR